MFHPFHSVFATACAEREGTERRFRMSSREELETKRRSRRAEVQKFSDELQDFKGQNLTGDKLAKFKSCLAKLNQSFIELVEVEREIAELEKSGE